MQINFNEFIDEDDLNSQVDKSQLEPENNSK